MSATVLWEDRLTEVQSAVEDGDRLWLAAPEFQAATGWTLKPVGLCREEACVPLPRDGSWSDAEGRVDLAAFAARLRKPIVRDHDHSVWSFGSAATTFMADPESVQAPDFALPDLEGELHRLSDLRSKKVLILSWGSY